MWHDILVAPTPLLVDLLALLLGLAIGWLSPQAHRYLGVQVEPRHREALHSAIMTGLRHSLAEDVSRERILHEALHYARTSVPDAVRALVKDDGVLRALAEARLRELVDMPGRASPVVDWPPS